MMVPFDILGESWRWGEGECGNLGLVLLSHVIGAVSGQVDVRVGGSGPSG